MTELPTTAATTGFDVSRRRATVTLTFVDVAAIDAAAGWVAGQFHTWARDAELYAIVLELRAADVGNDCAASVGINDLIWRLECFAKPSLCLLPGAVSPTALALALAGTHRVAALSFRGRLANLRSGTLPPGITLDALARLPRGVGAYLLLTGQTVGAADALALGIVTHIMPEAGFEALRAGLADADPIDPLLDDVPYVAPPTALHGDSLVAQMPLIACHFAADRLDGIVASLSQVGGADAAWAQATLAALKPVSKVVGDVALAALRRAGTCDVRQALILAAAFNQAVMRGGDLADLERIFSPTADSGLTLPTRADLQSLRRPG